MTVAPVVHPLVWSDSMVFGVRKYRGSSPFGEFEAFGGNNLSDAHVEAMKADIEQRYQEQVRAMLLPRSRGIPDNAKWNPLRKAIWSVVIDHEVNGPLYISAWSMTDKLYDAVLAVHPVTD